MRFSKNSLNKLHTCHKDLQKIMIEAIKNSPHDFAITHGHRTPDEQYKLYQKGRTQSGEIVTYIDGYKKKSKHNYDPSQAVDIAILVKGRVTWESKYYKEVAEHIMNIAEDLFLENKISHQLTWGGNWKKFKDYPHFNI